MKYVIESNIPIPPRRAKNPDSLFGKIRELKVGDSLFAPNNTAQILSSSARMVKQRDSRPDKKFKTRTVIEGGVKGARIWRVA